MSNPCEIRIPRQSANDDTVKLLQWHILDGHWVAMGDILLSVETAKAVFEIESEAEGYLQTLVPAGSEVEVGKVVAFLNAPSSVHSSPSSTYKSSISLHSPPQNNSRPTSKPSLEPITPPAVTNRQAANTRFSRLALAYMAAEGLDPQQYPGTGLVRRADVQAWVAQLRSPEDTILPTTDEPPPDTLPGEQPLPLATSPTDAGFFSDARKSAGERGKSIIWLAFNYFFRNYLLGHLARMAPLGINLLLHRMRGVKMGRGVYIDPSATIETAYPENITIGNDVRITANAIIMTHIKAPHALRNNGTVPLLKKPVVLEDSCFIGVNAVIMPGVTIGRGSIVTSGSVVINNVPPGVMVSGNPAQVAKRLQPTTNHS